MFVDKSKKEALMADVDDAEEKELIIEYVLKWFIGMVKWD